MPRADRLLYAALLRLGARFQSERLPLLGAAGLGGGATCWNLSWPATARRWVESPPPGVGLAEGAQLLHRLQQQLEVLLQAEEHTREALAEWAALANRFSLAQHASRAASQAFPPLAAAAAAEEGLALLSQQALELADPLQLELGEHAAEADSGGEAPAVTLDGLAASVRQQYPALFPSSKGGGSGGGRSSAALQVEQAQALAEVLYRQQRFKHEPFEWVYEGLQPLLLPPRLQRRKLAPLTLAAAVGGVGRRLGLPLLPVPAEPGDQIAAAVVEGPAGGAAAQGLPLDQLRPDVAQRYAGRAAGTAPAAGPWVLLLEPGSGGGAWEHGLDACSGQVLGAAELAARFPGLDLSLDWRLLAPLVGWQHMARTVIQAHQRRGESDLVAHWVCVLLALDPQAPEWGHMLPGAT